uniref:Putative secretory peptide-65 n=1 Tax=Pleurobrachia bachei TaxID=34499 RepID=M4H1W8_PLEBA|nr:putative secretory peptide-65 [Pleurobrachia bachei]|eukprot:sb/3478381/
MFALYLVLVLTSALVSAGDPQCHCPRVNSDSCDTKTGTFKLQCPAGKPFIKKAYFKECSDGIRVYGVDCVASEAEWDSTADCTETTGPCRKEKQVLANKVL